MRKNLSFFYCLSVFFSVVGMVCQLAFPTLALADGTYASLGTTTAADGSNDAINFSQGRVWTIDQYGKYIWLTERRATGSHYWTWSNNDGTAWTEDDDAFGFLTRGSVSYDSINDVLHVIWAATDNNDGIIYRRYGITRDGSNNITDIDRIDTNVNLQLDTTASRELEQPVALWLNDGSADGILMAFWTKHGTGINETRASMRRLSMTDADGVAGNWLAMDGTSDTFATDAPAVAADKVHDDTNGQSAVAAKIRGGSGSHKDDLYVFIAEEDDNSADTVIAYRATWVAGSLNWSGGWTSLGTIGAMNAASGYTLKYQLITKPVIDTTNDRLYIGWSRWKDGTNGDTASMAYLSSTDSVSSTVDIYSALGTHSYAPTLDIAYDSTMDQVYASYVQSTTNGDNGSIDYKTYDGTTLSSATRFYTTPGGSAGANGSADIPILYENRQNGRLLFAFRINGALPPTVSEPHTIDWGYITLPTPTPTPTATPTPTPSTSSTSDTTTSSGPSVPLAPVCSSQSPGSRPPHLYGSEQTSDSITLFFTEADTPFDQYNISYGYSDGDWRFGTNIPAHNGLRTFTISALNPNTTYYFRMRAGNGCATGPWSNTQFKVTTTQKAIVSQALFQVPVTSKPDVPSILKPISQATPKPEVTSDLESSPTPQPTPQESVVPNSEVQPPSQKGFFQRIIAFLLSLIGR